MIENLDKELQKFALRFDDDIKRPLVNAGFDEFNVFDILNISRQELRHSDFLAFLLDPSCSGEVGWQFLRNFLILLAADKIIPDIDLFTILYGNLDKVKVSREVAVKDGRIDILIELRVVKEEARSIVIAIENKIDTTEHDNQLEKYKSYLFDSKYKDFEKVMLYLSPDKIEPTVEGWKAIDYNFIHSVLCRVNTYDVDKTISTLINDYTKMIRREFGMPSENELRKKAIEIYKNNRRIFDYIYESIPNWKEETAKIFCSLLKEKGANLKNRREKNICIVFETKELQSYPGYYFQINIDEMCLLFIDNSEKRASKIRWLSGDKKGSEEAVSNFKEHVFDYEQLKDDCIRVVDKLFSEDGAIALCLADLKNKS